MALVVVLEDANDVDPAKAGEQTATAAQHYRPGLKSTVRKVIWIGAIGIERLCV